jgi:hypothetical protein
MGELVNLKRVRKQKARAAEAAVAAENRARHGQPKAVLVAERQRQDAEQKRLNGARIEPEDT